MHYRTLATLLLGAVLALGGPGTTQAADDRVPERSTEYKCHFEMVGGEQLVNYLMSKDKYAAQLQQEMAGKSIYAKNGVTRRYIYKVFECVRADQPFKSDAARALDEQTLS